MTYIKQAIQELKPCPFCGGTEIELSCGTPDREGIPKQMNCTECGASGPWDYATEESTEQQVKDWNTRPTPDLTERIEAAAEEIAKEIKLAWGMECDERDKSDIAAIIRRHLEVK